MYEAVNIEDDLMSLYIDQSIMRIIILMVERKVGVFLLESDIEIFGNMGVTYIPWICNPCA